MDRSEIETQFRELQHIVEKIAATTFRHALSPRGAFRPVRIEDLVQVGLVALLEAIPKWDETREASLKTFASKLIRDAMSRYIQDSISPIAVGSRPGIPKGYRQETLEKRSRAMKCRLFSEILNSEQDSGPIDSIAWCFLSNGSGTTDPSEIVDRSEQIALAIQTIRNRLAPDDYDMLLRRSSGEPVKSIAGTKKLAYKTASDRILKAKKVALEALREIGYDN